MAATSAIRTVDLDPGEAWALWTDVKRWPTFVEGFAHVLERANDWPGEGAKLVWGSTPDGRGRVTERVTASEPGVVFATQVFEEALVGTQSLTFGGTDDGRTRVELRLDYELAKSGPLQAVADVLFIRRALNQALNRTLARFATEAAEEGGYSQKAM
ncbi:MAG TPA: SRPBCC family protein [Thermoleophilaceae bacterium]|nr:SRPBCC family protein [Thermoleophilaceae bacterium]